MFAINPLLNTDSYKQSHYAQYPPGTTRVSSYIESRGGRFPQLLFFGLQAYLKEYLTEAITADHIAEAAEVSAAHGIPFNEAGWRHVLKAHGGRIPLAIEAVPEGTVLPSHNVLVQAVNTDPAVPWITGFFETALVRAVWYATSVATLAYHIRSLMAGFVSRTSDRAPEEALPVMLNDFGSRGVSSLESSAIGGLAHLVAFEGTDNMPALLAGRRWYGAPMAGVSVPAAEHSTVTAWGEAREADAFRNMIDQFAGKYPVISVVSDSYDIFRAVSQIWGQELRGRVMACGSTIVVRPDSGDPEEIVVEVIQRLMADYGSVTNAKGFAVLPDAIRIIQGDGVNINSIEAVLTAMEEAGLSSDNIVFGMGGALLQQLDRDTQKFAMKASAVEIDGEWQDIFKDPVTDPEKVSKKGRLALVRKPRGFETIAAADLGERENLLEPVFKDGELLRDETLEEIRRRALG